MFHRIFAASRLDTNVSRMERSEETGKPGRNRSIGTIKHTCSRQRQSLEGEKGIINKQKVEAKESIKIRCRMPRKD